uniref:Uncharacterized protein n=1 Tax=Aegilops tauschii subsp. strangulata TaxID=200361 RepID=A0A453H875_AEGTS
GLRRLRRTECLKSVATRQSVRAIFAGQSVRAIDKCWCMVDCLVVLASAGNVPCVK